MTLLEFLRIRALGPVTAAALMPTACGDNPLNPSEVQGVEWKLGTLQRADFSVLTIPEPSRFTVQFGADGRIDVLADCNRCSGGYTLNGNSLSVGLLACTLAFCPSTPLDTEYVSILQGARSMALHGDQLEIVSSGGTLRYTR